MDLEQALASVRDRVARQASRKPLNEQDTKATLIEPVLRALGWNTEDVEEVAREYRYKSRDAPVDYALFVNRTPRLIVEAKALGQNLGDRKWSHQTMGYAAVAGIDWVVLTDGDEYRIYNAHATVPIEEKLVRSFRLSASGDASSTDGGLAAPTLALLTRDRMQEHRLDVLWKALHVDRKVKIALDEILDPAADSGVLKLLRRRLKDFPRADLRASLGRARIAVSFPVPVELAAARSSKPAPRLVHSVHSRSTRSAATDGATGSATRRTRTIVDCSVSDLIAAGLIRAPLDLFRNYKGVDVRARIETDGTVVFGGTRTDSLSTAARLARTKVLSRDGKSTDKVEANGWTFWKFRDADGKETEIDTVRRQYLATRPGNRGAADGARN